MGGDSIVVEEVRGTIKEVLAGKLPRFYDEGTGSLPRGPLDERIGDNSLVDNLPVTPQTIPDSRS
jgi:hypothetical protein